MLLEPVIRGVGPREAHAPIKVSKWTRPCKAHLVAAKEARVKG